MSKPIIEVKGLSKQYRIGERSPYGSLREEIMQALARPFKRRLQPSSNDNTIWALKDISLEVREGEVMGIIGRNGAGKSTLLKILSRITEPTEGKVELRGRVASLLEVGTGFHPELTGRENILLNGALLGMTSQEIKKKFNEIVAFAEIEKFLDTPVKRYSSGMYVRLAFAVAAHLEPEILLVDEVLAVGDIEFQRKCLGKMQQITGEGRTVLFVSHNMPSIEALCHQAILLEDGQIAFGGDSAVTVAHYLGKKTQTAQSFVDLRAHPGRDAIYKPIFQSMRLLNDREEETAVFQAGDGIIFEMVLESSERKLRSPNVYVVILDSRGIHICQFCTGPMVNGPFEITGRTVVRCHWNTCQLRPGVYSVALAVKEYNRRLDRIFDASVFKVNIGDIYGTGRFDGDAGIFLPDGRWEFKQLS
jgi:lipopolysaccharide transport system ATP-binding protein